MTNIKTGETIVLGMHRSGTSMVSGVLERLGVDMGEDQPGRQISNPLGHFEDGDFLVLNNKILSLAGGAWDDPPALAQIMSLSETLIGEIQFLVSSRRKSNKEGLWGWKDPRTSLTINLYLPYLKNPFIVWCQRDPEEVARSLEKRNNLSREAGLTLRALYHNRVGEFLINNPHLPVHVIEYAEMLKYPRSQVESLVKFLGLTVDQDQVDQADQFVLKPDQINREKTILKFKYWVSLPARTFRKFFQRN